MKLRHRSEAVATEPGRVTLVGKVDHVTEYDDSWWITVKLPTHRTIQWSMSKPLDRDALPKVGDTVNVAVTW